MKSQTWRKTGRTISFLLFSFLPPSLTPSLPWSLSYLALTWVSSELWNCTAGRKQNLLGKPSVWPGKGNFEIPGVREKSLFFSFYFSSLTPALRAAPDTELHCCVTMAWAPKSPKDRKCLSVVRGTLCSEVYVRNHHYFMLIIWHLTSKDGHIHWNCVITRAKILTTFPTKGVEKWGPGN